MNGSQFSHSYITFVFAVQKETGHRDMRQSNTAAVTYLLVGTNMNQYQFCIAFILIQSAHAGRDRALMTIQIVHLVTLCR